MGSASRSIPRPRRGLWSGSQRRSTVRAREAYTAGVSRRALAIPFGHAVATAVALALATAGCAQILGYTQDYYQAEVPDSSTVVPGDGSSGPEGGKPNAQYECMPTSVVTPRTGEARWTRPTIR